MATKKELEAKIEALQEHIYETSFFLRYLVVDLEKYQEDPTEAIHDMHCSLNDPDRFDAHKVFSKETRTWKHPDEQTDRLCNCKIRSIITTIYEIKQYQRENVSILDSALKAHARRNQESAQESNGLAARPTTGNCKSHYKENRESSRRAPWPPAG